MKPESVEAMREVIKLAAEIHRALTDPTIDSGASVEEAHRLSTAANTLMLTVLCHELLDSELDLAQTLFDGLTVQ